MNLYEISTDFEQMFNSYDDYMQAAAENGIDEEEAQEAWFTTLDCMEEDVEAKLENIALFVKNTEADVTAIKAERERLTAREKAKSNLVKRLKDYMLMSMNKISRSKVETARAVVSVRNNAESVRVADEHGFIKWAEEHKGELLKYKEPEISKTAVKAALKNGEDIPYCTLERTQSVIIK
jgi:hypothetical protein